MALAELCGEDSRRQEVEEEPFVVKANSFHSGSASTAAPSCDVDREAGVDSTESLAEVADWAVPAAVLIFVDWDDTLFPTTWLSSKPMFEEWIAGNAEPESVLDDAGMAELKELDMAARAFVVAASRLGKVCCVTLARPAWIPACLRAFMPNLESAWRELDIQVHYASVEKLDIRQEIGGRAACCLHRAARNDTEQEAVHSSVLVHKKQRCMKRAMRRFYGKRAAWQNVLSFGDGPFEQQALQELSFEHAASSCESPAFEDDPAMKMRAKTVKMIESPVCATLCEELHVLQAWLPAMRAIDGDFNLSLDNWEDGDLEAQCELLDTVTA